MASKQSRSQADTASSEAVKRQPNSSGQSANSLSQSSDDQADDGRFTVAEEVNLDQQSDKARHVGQMSLDWGEVEGNETSVANTAPEPKRKNTRKEKLKQSLNRAVPPSQ